MTEVYSIFLGNVVMKLHLGSILYNDASSWLVLIMNLLLTSQMPEKKIVPLIMELGLLKRTYP